MHSYRETVHNRFIHKAVWLTPLRICDVDEPMGGCLLFLSDGRAGLCSQFFRLSLHNSLLFIFRLCLCITRSLQGQDNENRTVRSITKKRIGFCEEELDGVWVGWGICQALRGNGFTGPPRWLDRLSMCMVWHGLRCRKCYQLKGVRFGRGEHFGTRCEDSLNSYSTQLKIRANTGIQFRMNVINGDSFGRYVLVVHFINWGTLIYWLIIGHSLRSPSAVKSVV